MRSGGIKVEKVHYGLTNCATTSVRISDFNENLSGFADSKNIMGSDLTKNEVQTSNLKPFSRGFTDLSGMTDQF